MVRSQKITINLEVVDLGKMDLLVDRGFFSNRTDLVKHAVRTLLAEHSSVIAEEVAITPAERMTEQEGIRNVSNLGVCSVSRKELERAAASGMRLRITTVGALVFDANISPDLADETIESVKVYGVLKMEEAVKERLGSRIG